MGGKGDMASSIKCRTLACFCTDHAVSLVPEQMECPARKHLDVCNRAAVTAASTSRCTRGVTTTTANREMPPPPSTANQPWCRAWRATRLHVSPVDPHIPLPGQPRTSQHLSPMNRCSSQQPRTPWELRC